MNSRFRHNLLLFVVICFMIFGCSQGARSFEKVDSASITEQKKDGLPVEIKWRIVNIFPHAPNSFTQGLVFEDGFLYEGTGQYGGSSLRKIDIRTGKVLNKVDLPSTMFGEGIAILKAKIFQLTWLSRVGFIYDKESFKLLKSFDYPVRMEGWGLTHDGTNLIMSDGSPRLYYLDPKTFQLKKQITVTLRDSPVYSVNELEFIDGIIYANVWQSEYILRIDAKTGHVTGIIRLNELTPSRYKGHPDYVLNGIAFDPQTGHLFVTGKMWSQIYEIELLGTH